MDIASPDLPPELQFYMDHSLWHIFTLMSHRHLNLYLPNCTLDFPLQIYVPSSLCYFNKYWFLLVNSRRNRGVTMHFPLFSPTTVNQLSSSLDAISKYIFIHHFHLHLREASRFRSWFMKLDYLNWNPSSNLTVVWLWTGSFATLCLSFPICKTVTNNGIYFIGFL